MEINELSNQAHKIALEKGFYDKYNDQYPRPVTEFLMLIVTELAEACEADRNNDSKKFDEEIADAYIRLGDMCGYLKIDIEFKKSMNWNTSDRVKAKIAKHLMAFSNIRNGGYLVMGVRENSDHTFSAVGMSEDAYNSHILDSVLPYVNSKAEPPVNFDLRRIKRDEMRFVIYKIYPFENYPVFCKNEDDESAELHRGVIYTRTMRMYKSAPIQNQSEMDEIKEMILDKNAERLARRIQQINAIELQDDDQFDQEIEGLE